ncbi:MAG: DUF2306 domain-containing protein [Nevskiaceae bacterium]|nr:MAG: DUF2306 domain-containing protein [Nevskiaceae bacterium]
MTYLQLAYFHLAIVVPAFVIGTFLMLNHKGTPRHRLLGRVYLALMAITGIVTLFMPAQVGPRFLGHFGFIHLLSLLTLYSVPTALLAARQHRVAQHRRRMIGLYFGGLLLAGGLAFAPGRLLHHWVFGTPALVSLRP